MISQRLSLHTLNIYFSSVELNGEMRSHSCQITNWVTADAEGVSEAAVLSVVLVSLRVLLFVFQKS